MGWLFLWAFVDKVFGLGFATAGDKSWLSGASPTTGFLSFGVKGPFSDLFHALAGNPFVDWMFMLGLLGIGIAFVFGIAIRLASYAGMAMMFLMWLALLFPANNPFLDEHIIYLLVFYFFSTQSDAGDTFGFGEKWQRLHIVKKWKWLS